MPTENELLQAVLAKPDDDAPRLEYAKWCESQGDETTRQRGTLIRLQIAAFRAKAWHGGPAAEARQLIDRYGARWSAPFASLTREVEYSRGFVECVRVTPNQWLEFASRLRQLAPVRHLDLVECDVRFGDVVASPLMAGVRSLDVTRQGLNDSHAAKLAESQHVLQLRWLGFAGNKLTEPGVVALIQTTNLPSLRWANFYDNPFNPGDHHSYDSGAIVETWKSEDGERIEQRFGRIEWLHHAARNEADTEPVRFAV